MFSIQIHTYITYIYICSRPAAGQPPPSSTPSNHSTTPWGWPSSYALLTCWPRATYALPNRIPPCAVFTTAYMPIQSIYNLLLSIKSRSSVLYIRASHVLPIHYLHDTSKTPHPSHRGVGCVDYILHRAPYIQRTAYIQDHDHDLGGCFLGGCWPGPYIIHIINH